MLYGYNKFILNKINERTEQNWPPNICLDPLKKLGHSQIMNFLDY